MTFPDVQDLFGNLGYVLLISGIALYALQGMKRRPGVRWTILLLCVGGSLSPIGGLAITGYVRGVCGDLSVVTQILLGCIVIHHAGGHRLLDAQDRQALFMTIAPAGLVLYATAGRYWQFDAYVWGFDGTAIVLILLPVSLWLWRRRPRAGLVLLAGIVAWNLGLLESTNLWDYLMDPWVTLVAWGSLVHALYSTYAAGTGRLAVE